MSATAAPTAPNAAAAPAALAANGAEDKKKNRKLPEVEGGRVHTSKESLDKAAAEAEAKGWPDYARRKYEVKVNDKTIFVLGYNTSDAYGRACESGHLGDKVACRELDHVASKRGAVKPTVDGVLAVMQGFSEADRKRLKEALAAKK